MRSLYRFVSVCSSTRTVYTRSGGHVFSQFVSFVFARLANTHTHTCRPNAVQSVKRTTHTTKTHPVRHTLARTFVAHKVEYIKCHGTHSHTHTHTRSSPFSHHGMGVWWCWCSRQRTSRRVAQLCSWSVHSARFIPRSPVKVSAPQTAGCCALLCCHFCVVFRLDFPVSLPFRRVRLRVHAEPDTCRRVCASKCFASGVCSCLLRRGVIASSAVCLRLRRRAHRERLACDFAVIYLALRGLRR